MVKVLLIQPNENRSLGKSSENPATPISLVYLGTAIEDYHKVKIYDRNLILDDIHFLDFLKTYKPDIIGINSITSKMLLDLMHVGKLIKKNFPSITIVVGGVHATVEPDSLLEKSYIDWVIRGEGELAFLEFCNTFDENPENLKNLKNVNKNPLRPFVDMDKLKLPNYNLIDVKKYGLFYINMSRGCPGNCSFCYSPRMWRIDDKPCIRCYTLDRTKELFKKLVEEHGMKVFSVVDDNFIPMKSRAIEICKFLERYDLNFWCLGRADYINDEILKSLKKAGCHTIQAGLESGNQRVLDFLNKRITIEKNIEAIKCCKRNGIFLDGSFMIGITTETEDEMDDTIKVIKTYNPDVVNINIFNPLPGTPIFEYCIEKGLIKKPKNLEEWAEWVTSFLNVQHNTSNISDEVLRETIKEMRMFGFYKNKVKRFFYWIKQKEYDYAFKGIKRILSLRKEILNLK